MKILRVADLGIKHYSPVLELQRALHNERAMGNREDILLLVEHFPVYTIGKDGKRENIIASQKYLEKENISVFYVDRGGDVTYHGPGQIVGYPIFNLKFHNMEPVDFVRAIEEVFIMVLKEFKVLSKRIPNYPGVWVGEEKILAIGIRVAHWTTMHGFAFNIKPNLSHFLGIIPCGIKSKGVTSLERCIQNLPPISEIKESIFKNFCKIFQFDQIKILGEEIWETLKNSAEKSF